MKVKKLPPKSNWAKILSRIDKLCCIGLPMKNKCWLWPKWSTNISNITWIVTSSSQRSTEVSSIQMLKLLWITPHANRKFQELIRKIKRSCKNWDKSDLPFPMSVSMRNSTNAKCNLNWMQANLGPKLMPQSREHAPAIFFTANYREKMQILQALHIKIGTFSYQMFRYRPDKTIWRKWTSSEEPCKGSGQTKLIIIQSKQAHHPHSKWKLEI